MSDRSRFTQYMDGKIEVPMDGEEPFLIDMKLCDKEELQRNYTQYSKLSESDPEKAKEYYSNNMSLIKKLMKRSYPDENWTESMLETFIVKEGDAFLQGISIALKWIPKEVVAKMKSEMLKKLESNFKDVEKKKK